MVTQQTLTLQVKPAPPCGLPARQCGGGSSTRACQVPADRRRRDRSRVGSTGTLVCALTIDVEPQLTVHMSMVYCQSIAHCRIRITPPRRAVRAVCVSIGFRSLFYRMSSTGVQRVDKGGSEASTAFRRGQRGTEAIPRRKVSGLNSAFVWTRTTSDQYAITT